MTVFIPIRPAALVAWLLSMGAVIYASVIPHLELPLDFWNADKLYHAAAYAWLGFLPAFAFASPKTSRRAAYWMIVLGSALEAAQLYIPGRSGSTLDAVANAAGVFVGIWASEALRQRLLARQEAQEPRGSAPGPRRGA